MTEDRFGTAGIRNRVLAAWTASPARFREDANAEEDLVLGGYRDRLVVELAQNAADAAARAGVPGRLLLSLSEGADGFVGPVLVAANTGSPLDADGVQALATLRASAKRDDAGTVGRFGVGFAAVLAVSDEPIVMSRAGGVRFSAADTRELVRQAATDEPLLAEEVQRRDGQAPVLRLPFPAGSAVPDGYDTAVMLPLRDPAAAELVRRLLDEVDDALLIALPALDSVRIEIDGAATRTVADVFSRWRVLQREGDLDESLMAARPTEERSRSRWRVTWALPTPTANMESAAIIESVPGSRPGLNSVPPVVHAPTPCEEPLPWPALLVATLPLEPSRRHVAPGPVTDAVVRAAAEAYADLLTEVAATGEAAWRLAPTGLPAGAVDGALRSALAELLPAAAILGAAEDGHPLRPRDAVSIAGAAGADEATVAVLATRLAGLVLAPRAARPVLRQLGVRELELTDVVEALPEVSDPAAYQPLYAALDPLAVDPLVREALAALPVPLVGGRLGGRLARGARGLVLPDGATTGTGVGGDEVAAALAGLGARVVHPRAAHPLLERLGATPAGPRALLELDVVRAAVAEAGEELLPAPGELSPRDAVLTLVRAAVQADQLAAGDLPWLADLALPDDEGQDAPAGALALPGSPAARWFDPEEIGLVDADLLGAWGEDTLIAAGVLRGPGLIRAEDLLLDPDDDETGSPAEVLEGWADYCEFAAGHLVEELGQPRVVELVAVRDLDAVAPEALPEVVAAIAADPLLRPALTRPARVLTASQAVDVLPYTAWWLRDQLGQGGVSRGARDGLDTLLPEAPAWIGALDHEVQSALGVIGGLADVDAGIAPAVLDGLTDPDLDVSPAVLLGVLRRFAELAADGVRWPAPPVRVRGLSPDGAATVVVDADDAVVLESPMYLQRPDLGVPLPVDPAAAPALADLFDLPLAGELAKGRVAGGGVLQPTPAEVLQLLPGAPRTWCETDDLVVDGYPVDWWVGSGVVHAATVDGLARGLSWAAGRWDLRAVVQQVLADPATAGTALIDEVFRQV